MSQKRDLRRAIAHEGQRFNRPVRGHDIEPEKPYPFAEQLARCVIVIDDENSAAQRGFV